MDGGRERERDGTGWDDTERKMERERESERKKNTKEGREGVGGIEMGGKRYERAKRAQDREKGNHGGIPCLTMVKSLK